MENVEWHINWLKEKDDGTPYSYIYTDAANIMRALYDVANEARAFRGAYGDKYLCEALDNLRKVEDGQR